MNTIKTVFVLPAGKNLSGVIDMDCYTQTFPIARKVHNCDFCGKQIEKGEKYSRESWKDGGEFWNRILCISCEKILTQFCKENSKDEFDWDWILDWLSDKYCYSCIHGTQEEDDCEYGYSKIPNCPRIRKHFESLEVD